MPPMLGQGFPVRWEPVLRCHHPSLPRDRRRREGMTLPCTELLLSAGLQRLPWVNMAQHPVCHQASPIYRSAAEAWRRRGWLRTTQESLAQWDLKPHTPSSASIARRLAFYPGVHTARSTTQQSPADGRQGPGGWLGRPRPLANSPRAPSSVPNIQGRSQQLLGLWKIQQGATPG